jgi:phage gp16-like protein
VAEQREPLMGKIEAIILDTGLTWAYADGIARKMFGIDSVRFCDETQLWKIVAALSVHVRRQAKKEEGLK